MAQKEFIDGDRIGLMIARSECFALGLTLRNEVAPQRSNVIREKAGSVINNWRSKGIELLYPIDDKMISLGLRRLGRFGIATRNGRRWELTEAGRRSVDEAATPLVTV